MILLPIISTWMSIEGHRRLVQVVPDPMQKLWGKWELRGLVLISLVSLMVLAILGNRRKFRPNIWRRPLVWIAYMMADWVGTFALGVITSMLDDYYEKSSGERKDINPQLIAFWAPFFLIHLGGPDTITAYALEDNELWQRHLVGLVTQTILTFYIILMSWKNTSWPSYLSILMLIIGFIKYGERTWSLYSASTRHLRDSLLSMKNIISHGDYLSPEAFIFRFLGIFVSLFMDMILSSTDLHDMRVQHMTAMPLKWETSVPHFFEVNLELGLMYDVFYTKAFAVYNFWGLMLRLIILFATAIILLLHIIFTKSNEYLVVDRLITYMLLVGSVILEIYSFILIASSTWTPNLSQNDAVRKIARIVRDLCNHCCAMIVKSEDWEYHIGQANFLTLICNENKKNSVEASSTKRLHDIPNPSISYFRFSYDLQSKFFSHYQKKLQSDEQSNFTILPRPGYRHHIRKRLSIPMASNLEFHQTIIAWHIATDLCYYHDENVDHVASYSRTTSKQLSDYVFYLLVKCRHMLPVGAGLLTCRHTFEDARKHFQKNENLTEACRDLLQMNTNTSKEDENMSVFFHACNIAKELVLSRENEKEMWKWMAELWIEILSYASANCRVDNHAQQLRRGMEFLSHVWLLQAHFSLLEQFDGIINGRTEIPVEGGIICSSWKKGDKRNTAF